MRKIFMLLAAFCGLMCGVLVPSGCQYDDDDLWNEIDSVKTRLEGLRSQVGQMQALVSKLASRKGIVSVSDNGNGYVLTFTDNTTVVLNHGRDGIDGQDGKDGSRIGVQEEDGIHYWTVDGEFLLAGGKKVPVTGNDGHAPVMGIDQEGFWCVDGERVLSDGKPVPAQGDSFFNRVTVSGNEVVFTLADGSEFKVPMSSGCMLAFGQQGYLLKDGRVVLTYRSEGLSFLVLDQVPAGLRAELDEETRTVTVTLDDAASFTAGSRIILKGADRRGYAMLASATISVPDLKKADFIVLNEGWYGHEGGSINAYYDGAWDLRVFQGANPGMTLGTTSTVAVQNGDFLYIVSKDDRNLIEAETSSLKQKSLIRLEREQAMSFAAANGTQGYLATSNGIYEVALDPLVLGRKIFAKSTGDICCANGKVYFISSKKVQCYDPATGKTSVLCNAITGFTRTGEYLYAADRNSLIRISLADNSLKTVSEKDNVLTNSWAYTPTSLCSSADGKFVFYAAGNQVKRLNTATDEITSLWRQPGGRGFYGAGICLDRTGRTVYAISKKNGWGENGKDVFVEAISSTDGNLVDHIRYTGVQNTYWFPSQFVVIR